MMMRALVFFCFLLSACALREHAGRSRPLGPEPMRTDLAAITQGSAPRTDHAPPTEAVVPEEEEPIASAESTAPLHRVSESPVRAEQTWAVVSPAPVHARPPEQENLMPKKRWNRLAIPAFVAALGTVYLGLFTGSTYAVIAGLFVTLVLAGFSLRQIRHREEAGKGFAFAALMIGVIATLITALTIARYGLE